MAVCGLVMSEEPRDYWSVDPEGSSHVIWYKAENLKGAMGHLRTYKYVKTSPELKAKIAFLKLKGSWEDSAWNPINLEGIPIETP